MQNLNASWHIRAFILAELPQVLGVKYEAFSMSIVII